MILTEQIYAQAALLAGQLEERQSALLQVLCQGAAVSLENRLRDGLTAEDCRAEFVASASLYALAALNEAGRAGDLEEFRAGDLTVKKAAGDTASRCLQRQAELMMEPYLKDGFLFLGV